MIRILLVVLICTLTIYAPVELTRKRYLEVVGDLSNFASSYGDGSCGDGMVCQCK